MFVVPSVFARFAESHLVIIPAPSTKGVDVSDAGKPGRRMGQQGREEIGAMDEAALSALAAEHGVSMTNEDGTPVDRTELVNELANKVRQAGRSAEKEGDEGEGEAPA